MINRKEQPAIKKIESVDFLAPKKLKITPKVSLFHTKNVKDETTRFDLYFDAGKVKAENGIASFVNGLILSGTKERTSVQINNDINGLGGFYESGVSIENAVISMHCLRENILQKKFQKLLFANNDKYSSTLSLEDYDKVSVEDLKEFHKKNYLKGLTKVVVVGNVEQNKITYLAESCSQFIADDGATFSSELKNHSTEERIEKKGAIQSAIRVGRTLFNKNHPDYLDFLVLNTILGDYFGSRLMSNIREDKGYTYGIGSMISELQKTGYFIVATEVGHEVKDATLQEIKNEFKRLQDEIVAEEELQLVKNYMLGQLLKSADGPYAMMDLYLSAEIHGKNLNFYNKAIENIQAITSERIKELAVKYLDWKEMSVVVVG